MTLTEIITAYKPWADPPETWDEHSDRLWSSEWSYMVALLRYMSEVGGWVRGPVLTHDGYVQDAHHRLVIARDLGWLNRDDIDIPVKAITKNGRR
jgi:hypothetical protein